jgi:hypothetical protein
MVAKLGAARVAQGDWAMAVEAMAAAARDRVVTVTGTPRTS